MAGRQASGLQQPTNSSRAAPDWCYISSGTWALMGIESPQPIINDMCRRLNFTNEGGVGGTTRVLKNITGLWLLEQCRRKWKQDGNDFTWPDLVKQAEASRPLASLVNPDAPSFVAPKDMPQAIRDFCAQSQQPVPQSPGELVRTALESLALRYRMVLGMLEELVGSEDAETLRLNTGHIGYVVGRAATRDTVPAIIDWIVRHSEPLSGRETSA